MSPARQYGQRDDDVIADVEVGTLIFYRRYTINLYRSDSWRPLGRWSATVSRGLMPMTPAKRVWRSHSRTRLVNLCVRLIERDAIKYTMARPQIRIDEWDGRP